MANENMRMSATGYGALQFSEGVVMRYYNDSPRNGNCTWDIGSLAQHFMNNVISILAMRMDMWLGRDSLVLGF